MKAEIVGDIRTIQDVIMEDTEQERYEGVVKGEERN